MANIDKVSVKNRVYNIVSPAVVSDYIEVIGGACTKPDGYVENEVILAKQNDVQLLFKATQTIAFGANIVENTNCVRTTLEEVLKNAGGGGGASTADQVSYDNSDSGLEAENVQEAVDELATKAGTASSQIQTLTQKVTDMNNVLGAKNLLPNYGTTKTINTVVFTVYDDGSINANGTASGAQLFELVNPFSLKKGNYILSDGGGSISDGKLQIVSVDGTSVIAECDNTHHSVSFTVASDTTAKCRIYFTSGAAFSNKTFYPMLRLASDIDDTYVPYAMTNREMTPYVQAISNPNLLDNPWFTVNQRGFASTSSAGYTVDRWQLSWNPGNITVSLGNNGITLDATNSTDALGYFAQFIDNLDIAGKVVTASVLLADGTIKTGTGVMPTKGSTGPYIITGEFNLYLQYNSNNDTPRLYISIGEGHSVTIRAVKLELGSVSTLANDTAPNYQQELAKCQRYYQRIGYGEWVKGQSSTASFWLSKKFAVPMRATPTITVITQTFEFWGMIADDNVAITAMSKGIESKTNLGIGYLQLIVTTTGSITDKMIYSAGVDYIEVSADL